MTTRTAPQTETTAPVEVPVGERTDRELENVLNALLRSNVTRRKQVAKIEDQILTAVEQIDAIIDEQTRRLQAKRSKKPTASSNATGPVETKE